MALTTTQLQTLKADIAADSAFDNTPHNSDGAWEVAEAYNSQAVPDFTLWKTAVPTSDAKIAMVWTEYIDRSQGERDAWKFMLSNGIINPADVNVRQGIADIFSGPLAQQTRDNLLAIGKRLATRVQKLFATGIGSDASPATATVESVTYQDVLSSWNTV